MRLTYSYIGRYASYNIYMRIMVYAAYGKFKFPPILLVLVTVFEKPKRIRNGNSDGPG